MVLELDGGRHRVWLVNTHLHHVEADEHVRVDQASQILDWCSDENMRKANVGGWVLIGDMNATPELSSASTGECYALLRGKGGLSSAFLEAEGKEPRKTFPSGLKAPKMDASCPEGIC